MRKISFVFLLFGVSILISSCQKQVAQNANPQKEIQNTQTTKTPNEIPKDWKRVETDAFSFSIPQTLKKNNVRGIDSNVLQFENDEMILDIEWGDYSEDVGFNSNEYENKKEEVNIDEEKTVIVSWDLSKPTSSQMSNAMSMTNGTMSGDQPSKPKKIDKIYNIGVNFLHKSEVISPGDRPAISFSVRSENLESQEIAKMIFQSIKFKK